MQSPNNTSFNSGNGESTSWTKLNSCFDTAHPPLYRAQPHTLPSATPLPHPSARSLELVTDEHQVLDGRQRGRLVLSGDQVAVDDHVRGSGVSARVARPAVPQAVLQQHRALGEVAVQALVVQRRLEQAGRTGQTRVPSEWTR